MYTQCPQCDTVFQISAADLGLAEGEVRCGQCETTFNALVSLSEMPPAGAPRSILPGADDEDSVPDELIEAAAARTENDVADPFWPGQQGAGAAALLVVASDIPEAPDPSGESRHKPLVDEPDPHDESSAMSDSMLADGETLPKLDQDADAARDETRDSDLEPQVDDEAYPRTEDGSYAPSLGSPEGEREDGSVDDSDDESDAIPDHETDDEIDAASDDEPAGETEEASDDEPAGETEEALDDDPDGETEEASEDDPDGEIEAASDAGAEPDYDYEDAPEEDELHAAREALANAGGMPTGALADEKEVRADAQADALDLQEYLGPVRRPWIRFLWSAGAALALSILLVQGLHHWRDDLLRDERFGGLVRSTYDRLGIPLAPDWDVSALQLLAQAEIFPDRGAPDQPPALRVTAALVNRAAHPQPRPLIRVTLLDRWGGAVASRGFNATEYGDAESDGLPLLAPGEKMRVDLRVVDPGVESISYTLDICLRYPDEGLRCNDSGPD